MSEEEKSLIPTGNFFNLINASNINIPKKMLRPLFYLISPDKSRLADLMMAQTDTDADDIRNGKKVFDIESGKLIEKVGLENPIAALPLITERDNLIKQFNLSSTMSETIKILKDKEYNGILNLSSNQEISTDFLTKWKAEVEIIEDVDIQKIWAKILANEIETPNKTTLQTIETLKNFSLRTVKNFEALLQTRIYEDILLAMDQQWLKQNIGLTLNDIIELEAIGVLLGATSNSLETCDLDNDESKVNKNVMFSIQNGEKNSCPNFHVFFLTISGVNISNINKDIKAHPDVRNIFARGYRSCLSEKGKEIEIRNITIDEKTGDISIGDLYTDDLNTN